MPRISDFLNRICERALIILLAAMAVAVFLQVLFRYLLHLPLFWTEEFARYCLVWASLLGAAVALKRGGTHRGHLFPGSFPQKGGQGLDHGCPNLSPPYSGGHGVGWDQIGSGYECPDQPGPPHPYGGSLPGPAHRLTHHAAPPG